MSGMPSSFRDGLPKTAIISAHAEARILRWMTGGFLTQTALLVAVLALMR